jgi:hypothetical protein
MTTMLKFLAGALLAASLGAAQALPITDTYTPAAPATLRTSVPYTYTHNLLVHGFDPLLDTLSSVTLTLDIAGPSGQSLNVIFDASPAFGGTLGTFLTAQPFAVQLEYLQSDGLLDVSLTKAGGGGSTFTFFGSTLFALGTTVTVDDDTESDPTNQIASVPEPGTLALLGLGLLGGLFVGRRES